MNDDVAAHLDDLRQAGHDITVTPGEGSPPSRYFVVFKGYPVPSCIWGVTSIDLLLIVPALYPMAKLDMFWVDPPLLVGGTTNPQAGDAREQYVGRVWQRFSWHPQKWTVGRDTVQTYLETVNHRLHQKV